MLSGTGGSPAAISSMTVLKSSLDTAVTGAKVVFTATVENAATDVPITSGKVNFVVESPTKITLGKVSVNKQGLAGIATTNLTSVGTYRVEAQYSPTNSNISASVASPVKVKVIPVPLNVPTVTTLTSGVPLVETGQSVSLVATVKDAGTGAQIDAGLVEPMTGSVAFLTDSPNPIVLGEANLKDGQAAISTTMLKNIGPYQIIAEFLPANNYYAVSKSAPTTVTITPATVGAPTVTTMEAVPSTIETGEPIVFNATVQNTDSGLADGVVEFVTVARHPQVLGAVNVTTFGTQVSFGSFELQKVGTYQIEAKYLPNTNRYAASTSAPITVAVTPLTAASFRITPQRGHGHLGGPLTFAVTALSAQNQPVENYTGTVALASPTDSWTIFPASVYRSLNTAPPSLLSPGLATFDPQSYTFTAADHGTHTFVGGVTFGKAGAESLKVTQANNPKVSGKFTFAIG